MTDEDRRAVRRNADLVYRLRGLRMAGAVLHIGAHPDDEDVGLLSYMAHRYGVPAVYWSATRGEGGQNRIGPYRGEALGIYRSWEALAARAIDGGGCLYGPFFDFGYSKNADEALTRWGKENMVREVVRAIRMAQPLVIVARWRGISDDFHGHHQAVGKATLEAFEVAGDATVFPELEAEGLPAWQPLKFYHTCNNSGGDQAAGGAANLFGTHNPDFEKPGFIRLNTGEFDPIAGRTYQELAWLAYNEHKTQAMGVAPAKGDFYYYFSLHKSLVRVPEREIGFYDGLDPTLVGLADYPGNGGSRLRQGLTEARDAARAALAEYRADEPQKAAEHVLRGLGALRSTKAMIEGEDLSPSARQALASYLDRKATAFEAVAGACLGLELDAVADRARVTPGTRFGVTGWLWNQRNVALDEVKFSLHMPEGWKAGPGRSEQGGVKCETVSLNVEVPSDASLSCPYWLVTPRGPYHYRWPLGGHAGRPFGSPEVEMACHVQLGGQAVTLLQAIVGREKFPGGYRELPVAVMAPISLHPKTAREFLKTGDQEQHLELQVTALSNSEHAIRGQLELEMPAGWSVEPAEVVLSLPKAGSVESVRFSVQIPAGTTAGHYPLRYKARVGGREYDAILTPVRMGTPGLTVPVDGANCIKEEFIVTPAEVIVHIIDTAFMPRLRYAYVAGVQEDVTDCLKPFGVEFQSISDAELGYLDLSEFDAVVIGPNAYLVRDELRKYSGRFLKYIEHGGTLIVQYQGYGYQGNDFTPYPFRYNQPHDRVTLESAPVTVLKPDHSLFHQPNQITDLDFEGWLHERGMYFFGQWDDRYETMLACSDPGESPRAGGLVIAGYGQGAYIYTGYSFYRQLAAGVPGGFRLFANILGQPAVRLLERMGFLREVGLFASLKDEQLEAIARRMSSRWLKAGAYLAREGEMGSELYVVSRGELEILKESGGQERLVAVVGKSACVGELAVLGDVPRTASMRARGDVQLLALDGKTFKELLRQNPEVSLRVIDILMQRYVTQK